MPTTATMSTRQRCGLPAWICRGRSAATRSTTPPTRRSRFSLDDLGRCDDPAHRLVECLGGHRVEYLVGVDDEGSRRGSRYSGERTVVTATSAPEARAVASARNTRTE